jgi:hypothetical protein
MSEIDSLEPEDERFMATVAVLRELLAHPIAQEEREFFPTYEREMDPSDLDQIAEDITQARPGLRERGVEMLVTMLREKIAAEPGISKR